MLGAHDLVQESSTFVANSTLKHLNYTLQIKTTLKTKIFYIRRSLCQEQAYIFWFDLTYPC